MFSSFQYESPGQSIRLCIVATELVTCACVHGSDGDRDSGYGHVSSCPCCCASSIYASGDEIFYSYASASAVLCAFLATIESSHYRCHFRYRRNSKHSISVSSSLSRSEGLTFFLFLLLVLGLTYSGLRLIEHVHVHHLLLVLVHWVVHHWKRWRWWREHS